MPRPDYAGWNLLIASLLASLSASADPWLAPGDPITRHDLEMLADAGVIKGPITQWPIPWPDIARDVNAFDELSKLSGGEQAAFSRVTQAVRAIMHTSEIRVHARAAGTNEPDELRGFAATSREDGEIEAGIAWTGNHLAFRAQATAVIDADDGKTLRPDGSYVGATLWNMMLSAGYMDRWWGPGWEGSLILSSSARPIPTITLERNYSDAFSIPILKWFGPWRASIGLGALEEHREDFDDTRIFEARVTFKPWQQLEIGLSRTALICGEGRPCDLGTFWDMFTGNDNDQDPSQQPGDQLAGYDLRWSSPWRAVRLAVYGQMIGEDEAGALPSKFLGLFGVEHWGSVGSGSYRMHLEYADTACDFSRQSPEFDCAYESGIYTAGYRYRDRGIGHSLDSDSRMTALGVLFVQAHGASWELIVRNSKLNRDATVVPESTHTLAALVTDVSSVDLTHRHEVLGGKLTAAVGVESREVASPAPKEREWRALTEWVRDF